MDEIEFTKIHCGGNDFVLVDLREKSSPISLPELATRMCMRRLSVGGDGLLAIGAASQADLSLRYFNQDGSEPQFCGNGALCVSLWALENGVGEHRIHFEWAGREYEAHRKETAVVAELPAPEHLMTDLRLRSGKVVDYVVCGVPHVVVFESELHELNVEETGRKIRYDGALPPGGANVDFCQLLDRRTMRLRTYERGVEGETLACGSGAASAVYVAHTKDMTDTHVEVFTCTGSLNVHIEGQHLFLEGRPLIVYRGFWRLR